MNAITMKRITFGIFTLTFVISSCGKGAQGDSSGVVVKVGDDDVVVTALEVATLNWDWVFTLIYSKN